MAKHYYRLESLFDWQGNFGNALIAFINNPDSGKIVTFRSIEAYPVTTARGVNPFFLARASSIFGGEEIKLTRYDNNANLPSGIRVLRCCGFVETGTMRSSCDWWNVVSPGASAPAPLSPFGISGCYLREWNRGYFFESNFPVLQPITLRSNEAMVVRGSLANLVNPVRVYLELSVNGYGYACDFFSYVGSSSIGVFGVENKSQQVVNITKIRITSVGSTDTPFFRIVPIEGIVYEAVTALNQKVPSTAYVKYDTSSPDLTENVLIAYMNVPVKPAGVPIEYASPGGAATPKAANYLQTRDFIGPQFVTYFPEIRTAGVGVLREDLGFLMKKKFSMIKQDIILRPGEAIAIVSSAETIAAWTGTAAWVVQFGFDIEVADIEFTLTLTGIKQGSEVRIYDSDTEEELAGTESVGPSGEFSYSYVYEPNKYVDIVVHHLGYVYCRIDRYKLQSKDVILPIFQQLDRQYANP